MWGLGKGVNAIKVNWGLDHARREENRRNMGRLEMNGIAVKKNWKKSSFWPRIRAKTSSLTYGEIQPLKIVCTICFSVRCRQRELPYCR